MSRKGLGFYTFIFPSVKWEYCSYIGGNTAYCLSFWGEDDCFAWKLVIHSADANGGKVRIRWKEKSKYRTLSQ